MNTLLHSSDSLNRRRFVAANLRSSLRLMLLLLLGITCGFVPDVALAQPGEDLEKLRALYVPIDSLDAALRADKFGAVLSQEDFQQLIEDSSWQSPTNTKSPTTAILSSATYEASLGEERLHTNVTVQLRTFGKTGDEVDLQMAGWNVELAKLDGEPAIVTRVGEGLNTLRLFVLEPGRHVLSLTLSSPLRAVGSDKLASVTTVGAASETMTIEMPPGKFLKLGSIELERPTDADEPATYTVPLGGTVGQQIEMMVTDRQQASRSGVLTFANTAYGLRVHPSEVSWLARTDLQVFGESISKLVCSVPNSLEISGVEASGLESWELVDAVDGSPRTEIMLQFRQPFDGTRQITFRGILSQSPEEPWKVPNLAISNVTSHTGVVVVQHPPNLRLQVIDQTGVRPVANSPAAQALFGETAGQLFFEVWEESFGLEFVAVLKEVQLQAAMTNLLNFDSGGIDLSTTLSLQTRLAPLFDVRIRIPAEYLPTSVLVEGTETTWETVPAVAGINEIRVSLDPPLLPGQTRTVALAAHVEPESWPVESDPVRVAIPEVRLPQAAMVEALYGVTAPEELEIIPVDLSGLDPARQSDIEALNNKLRQTGHRIRLGFTYQDTVFSGQLEIRRRETLLTVRNVLFFRIDRETVFSRLESGLSVTGGGVRELQVRSSESAGDRLRFDILPTTKGTVPTRIVEQTSSDLEDGQRTWTLKFDRYLNGEYLLTTEVREPRSEAESYSPPRFNIVGVDVESGFVAIEAANDEFVRITAQTESGEPLTSVDPVDFPPSVYRPSERMVAGYRYIHPGWTVAVSTTQFDRSAVPTAIGHHARIVSVIGKAGDFQHEMSVELTAVGIQNLKVILPEGARLWSTLIDGTPVEARQTDNGVLLPVQGLEPTERHTLQLVYATDLPANGLNSRLRTTPPALSALTGDGVEQPLEILDQDWTLHYPDDTVLISSDGAFRPADQLWGGTFFDDLRNLLRIPQPKSLLESIIALVIATAIILLIGIAIRQTSEVGCASSTLIQAVVVTGIIGILVFLMLPAVQQSREAARRSYIAHTTAPEAMTDEYSAEEGAASDYPLADPVVPVETAPFGSTDPIDLPNAPAVVPSRPEPQSRAIRQQVEEKAMQQAEQLAREVEPADKAETESRRGRPMLADDESKHWKSLDFKRGQQSQSGNGQSPAAAPSDPFAPAPPYPAAGSELGGAVQQLDDTLSLQIQQDQTIDGYSDTLSFGVPVNRASGFIRASGVPMTGGLLSMAFVLQIPDETRSQQFEYEGNGQPASETALDVRFADGDSNRVLLYALAFGVALLGWWLRNARTTLKAGYLFLVIVVPIAVIGLIPGLYETALFGVLLGGVMTIAAWLLLLCAQCCQWCRDHFSPISSSGIKLLLMAALLSSAGLPAFAAEPVSKTGPQVAVPPPLPDPVRDPYVVIPYESLEDIDQADKVWVPADLYRKLWRAAHPNEVLTPKSAQGLVAEANYVARLTEGDSPHVEIQARWVLVNLTNRAITIPLPIQQPGLMDVQKNGEPVPLIVNKENAAAVVLHESGVSIIDATLMLPADVQRSVGQFQLALSPVGAGVLTFELPASEEELAVRVNGSTGTYRLTTEGDQKRVEIPVDAGGKVAVNWQPEAQQGNADQLVQVQSAITLDVSDLGIQQRCGFRVTVRQGGLNDLSFELPEELAVKGINGQDIAGWERVDDQSPRQLKVFFRRTISDSTDFTLDLFQDRQLKQASETVNFPLIAPLGVTRETGALSIAAPDHLRVRVTETNGLQQIDLAQYKPTVSPSAATSGPVIAYRFSARPISITAELSRREAEVRSLVDHGVDIGRRKIIIASRFQLELQGTPQRLLTFSLPDGYLTMDVVCQQAVDWYEVDNGGETQLVIELQNPITGSIEVGLEGHLVKDPEDATVSASVPAFAGSTRQTVSVGVWFDDLYQASLSNSGDWRAVPVGQLSQGIRQLQSRAPQFGFRTTEDNGPLEFQLRRATPELTADEATLIAVTDATIDYGFTIRWNIANAAADEFAFTVPDWLGTLEIAGPGIRQVQSTDAGGGRTRWTISLVDPVREQYLVTAAATVGTPQDFVVQTPAIEIESATGTGSFEPLETQRTFAVLVNLSGDQLVPVDLEQFESVAVDQLPLSLPDALVRQAMEITRTRNGRSPSWRIQRLETADAAQAVVLSATLTTVLEMDGSWRTNAVYGIRNRGQQFLGLKLPEESRILSVFVRGVPSRTVLTSVNNEPVHLVALPQTSEVDLSFDVNVLLEGRLGRSLPEAMSLMGREVRIPVPQVVSRNDSGEFGLSVAQTLWTVHVPDDLDANPVREPKATNLTWHAEQAWIAQERQRLSRLESDLNEMMRIASDAKAGYSRRNAAISNLKKLKRDLANQSEQASSLDASGPVQSEANELAEENRKLSELVQETIDSNSDFDANGTLDGVQLQQNFGRSFVLGNNIDVQNINGGQGVTFQAEEAGKSINFYSIEDTRRWGKGAKDDLASNTVRGGLKDQLAKQAPIVRFEKKSLPTSEPMGERAVEFDSDFGNRPLQRGVISGGRILLGEEAAPNVGSTWMFDDGIAITQLGRGAEPGSGNAAEGWTSAGGLSLQMTIPTDGHQLAFSKVGGNPELTLAIRSRQVTTKLLAGVWCLATLLVGFWVVRRISGAGSWLNLFAAVAVLAIVVGIAGFLFLPGELRWGFFTLFCFGGFVKMLSSSVAARAAQTT